MIKLKRHNNASLVPALVFLFIVLFMVTVTVLVFSVDGGSGQSSIKDTYILSGDYSTFIVIKFENNMTKTITYNEQKYDQIQGCTGCNTSLDYRRNIMNTKFISDFEVYNTLHNVSIIKLVYEEEGWIGNKPVRLILDSGDSFVFDGGSDYEWSVYGALTSVINNRFSLTYTFGVDVRDFKFISAEIIETGGENG